MCRSKYLELSAQARRWASACWDKALQESYEDLAKAYEEMAQRSQQLMSESDCPDPCDIALAAE